MVEVNGNGATTGRSNATSFRPVALAQAFEAASILFYN
jgi:hypothetical protein